MSKLVARWLGVSDVKITIVPSQEATSRSTSTTHDATKRTMSGRNVACRSVIGLKKLRSQSDGRDIEQEGYSNSEVAVIAI
jgi:hypothetical protein